MKWESLMYHRMQDETGATVAEIVRAHAVASQIFGTNELQRLISNLSHQISATKQIEMLIHVKRLIRRTTRWLIRNRRMQLDIQSTLDAFVPSANKLAEVIPNIMVGGTKEYMDSLIQEFVDAGFV